MNKQGRMVGYTSGVFDLFHVGHVNLLRAARSLCTNLIVGVSTDELVLRSKKSVRPIIPFTDRCEVVRACRYVDVVIPQESRDKVEAHHRLKYDILFVGDDWYGEPKWREYEETLAIRGARVVYLPYTKGTSSTQINEILERERSGVAQG